MLVIVIAAVAAVVGAILGAICGVVLGALLGALVVFWIPGGGGLDPSPGEIAILLGALLGPLIGCVLAVVVAVRAARKGRLRSGTNGLSATRSPSPQDRSASSFATLPRRAWLVGLALIWALLWMLYTPSLLFPGPGAEYGGPQPHEVFLFFVPRNESQSNFLFSIDDYCSGGVYESIPAAAVIGGVLFAGTAALGWRRPRRRMPLTLAFVGLYIAALVFLWQVVSPAIWGDVLYLTD